MRFHIMSALDDILRWNVEPGRNTQAENDGSDTPHIRGFDHAVRTKSNE